MLRHGPACAFSGESFRRTSEQHDLCCCDPHGTKQRDHEEFLLRWAKKNVLQQDEIWYPKEGDAVRLVDMSLRWKKNLLALLERRAHNLHVSYCWDLAVAADSLGGEMARDSVDRMADEAMQLRPVTWLYQQPLVVKLEQLIRWNQDGPVDRNRIEAAA